jgi:hypothetical protein
MGVGLDDAFFGRQGSVADETVKPGVDDFNFEFVALFFHGLGNIDLPGSGPDDAEVFSVQADASEEIDRAEIKEKFFSLTSVV